MEKAMNKNVIVTSYNPHWPIIFEAEAIKIREALGDNCIAVHHVGSTSVPGLIAKPKIDIIAVVKDLKKQGIRSLHDKARPDTVKFYRKNGYTEMLFDDPSGEPSSPLDVAIGKIL
jgi:GrpB-like predicted nucleotidyltransferase (UPF0157 family)